MHSIVNMQWLHAKKAGLKSSLDSMRFNFQTTTKIFIQHWVQDIHHFYLFDLKSNVLNIRVAGCYSLSSVLVGISSWLYQLVVISFVKICSCAVIQEIAPLGQDWTESWNIFSIFTKTVASDPRRLVCGNMNGIIFLNLFCDRIVEYFQLTLDRSFLTNFQVYESFFDYLQFLDSCLGHSFWVTGK